MGLDLLDTRLANDGDNGIRDGWHGRDVYYEWRLVNRYPRMGLLDNCYPTRYTNVFNCSHNGS